MQTTAKQAAAHTPGPWAISGQLIHGAPERRPNPKVEPHPHTVAAVCWDFDGDRGATGDLPWPVAAANARLIAAAPELLAAARIALDAIYEHSAAANQPARRALHALQTAINKVQGGAL